MTLIELLVVMGLLAALATMALSALDGLGEHSRMDTTVSRLDDIRHAVLGDGRTAGRFVADMGRWPMVRSAEEGEVLNELWKDPGLELAAPFSLRSLFSVWGVPGPVFNRLSDAHIEPWFGWGGPYLIAPYKELYDGFGNAFEIDHHPVLPDVIAVVRSQGRDGTAGGASWLDQEHELKFGDFLSTSTLEVSVLGRQRGTADETGNWQPLGVDVPLIWSGGVAVEQYERRLNTELRHVFECTTPGLTGSVEPPDWEKYALGDKTEDNEVLWRYLGPIERFPQYVNRLKVVVFVPDTFDDIQIGYALGEQSDGGIDGIVNLEKWGDPSPKPLTPGPRRLYVLAYLTDPGETIATNIWASGRSPQPITLAPGANHVSVYLTQYLGP